MVRPLYRLAVELELLAEAEAREHESPARVLFLHIPHQIRGVADLSFDFLLAVPKVVVGDDRDDHPVFKVRQVTLNALPPL
jgi:hypothetical protein